MSFGRRKQVCSGQIFGAFDLSLKSFPGDRLTQNNVILHTSRQVQAILHHLRPDTLVLLSPTQEQQHRQPSNNWYVATYAYDSLSAVSSPIGYTCRIGVRSYSKRSYSLADHTDQQEIFSLVRHAVEHAADRLGVSKLNVHEKDIVLASHILAIRPADASHLLHCKPHITAVVHAGPNSARQLTGLESLRLLAQQQQAAVLTTDLLNRGAASIKPRRGWAESSVQLLTTAERLSPRLARITKATSNDAPRLRSKPSPANMFHFLSALEAYALPSPSHYVLYIDPSVERITPQSLVYMAASSHAVRKTLSVKRTGLDHPVCDQGKSVDDVVTRFQAPKYLAPFYDEMWYIPAGGVPRPTTTAKSELAVRLSKSLKLQIMGFTTVSVPPKNNFYFCLLKSGH